MQVESGHVMEVGLHARCATQTLPGCIQVVTESDRQSVGVIWNPVCVSRQGRGWGENNRQLVQKAGSVRNCWLCIMALLWLNMGLARM